MAEKIKKLGEVFNDYKTNSNIKYANVTALNVIKKTSTLQVILEFDEYIEIKEIWYFEKFLKDRFKFEYIDIKIGYHENTEKKSVKDEWKNIIAYMSHKYPLAKSMLSANSEIEENGKELTMKMQIMGAEFLKAKKIDKELKKVLSNLFGIEYNISIIEEISKENVKAFRESIKKQEKELVRVAEEKRRQAEENNNEGNDNQALEYNDLDYVPPTDVEGYIPEEMSGIAEVDGDLDIRAREEYIMGKSSRAKEKFINIKDISSNDGKVTLEGRVLTSEIRETKSGKGMIIFDIYDGTGTITVKSFAKDMIEGNEIIQKIEKAIVVKVTGKAGLDTYVGDITVIANIIIATNKDIPEPPEEEMTPLILGVSQNITENLAKVEDLSIEDGKIALQGEVIFSEDRKLKSGKTLFSFDLYDGTSTITCKVFLDKDKAKKVMGRVNGANGLKLSGTPQLDTFSGELTVMANTVVEIEGLKKEKKKDSAKEKRVELHLHTKMSQMDGMNSAKDLIKRAMDWGMKSIAITDHGIVQAFPEAHKLLRI